MWLEIMKSFLYIVLELTLLFVAISFVISLLQGIIPYNKMEQWLEKSHPFISAGVALLFAFLTPFCSCSTIPVVVNLFNLESS